MNQGNRTIGPTRFHQQNDGFLRPLFAVCVPFFILFLVILGCKPNPSSNGQTPNQSIPETKKSEVVEQPETSSQGRFEITEICNLPKEVAPNTPFGRLGGGRWARTSNFDQAWDYDCEGDTGFLKSEENEKGTIALEYGAIGGPNDVKYLSVEYTATRFNGLDKSELEHRKSYVDFVDRISKRLFNEPLPDSVKKQLLGTKDIRKEDSGTPVGSGYVNTSVNLTNNKVVMTDIHFFESKDVFDKYKDK